LANNSKTGQDKYVNFRVTKEPKEVLIQNGIPTTRRIKEKVLKCLSVSNMVIAAANTGNARSKRKTVTKMLHTKSGKEAMVSPGVRIFTIVTMMLIAPNKEESPAKWRLKIAKSTAPPECTSMPERGG
jgi:hypothetical protein